MSKRKYVKRSDYWDKFKKEESASLESSFEIPMVGPSSSGEPYYMESKASSYKEASPLRTNLLQEEIMLTNPIKSIDFLILLAECFLMYMERME